MEKDNRLNVSSIELALAETYEIHLTDKARKMFTKAQQEIINCWCMGIVSRNDIAQFLNKESEAVKSLLKNIYPKMVFYDFRERNGTEDQKLYVFIKFLENKFLIIQSVQPPSLRSTTNDSEFFVVTTQKATAVFTETEIAIIQCFLRGHTDDKSIAEHKTIGIGTIQFHTNNIFNKSGVPVKQKGRRSRLELIVHLIKNGMITTVPASNSREKI